MVGGGQRTEWESKQVGMVPWYQRVGFHILSLLEPQARWERGQPLPLSSVVIFVLCLLDFNF